MTDVLLVIAIILLVILILLVVLFRPDNKNHKINELTDKMDRLTDTNYQQQIKLMETLTNYSDRNSKLLSDSLTAMQEDNEKKLEQIRLTVDDKLSDTLNKRINSSFEQVSVQLQNVYKSLGEMKELSKGVTLNVQGLNRVLTNVKARGTWAEYQLENILEQTIPKMYDKNVRTNPKYNGQVEFAVKIPNSDDDSVMWLPIDSKFPMEDYIRLMNASENGDAQSVESAKKALEARVRDEAKKIKNYISQPETTPFAIMYLATEGLYAEIMRSKTGIAEKIQNEGILIAGPSTVTALLNSLQIGFSSIAVNKRANEVWKILGNAKKQYDTFGILLEKARKKIEEAGKSIDEADHRNDIIKKNLKSLGIAEE